MKREETLQRIREARMACERGEPLSVAEMAEYRVLIANEMARAEARRQPSPQLDLGA